MGKEKQQKPKQRKVTEEDITMMKYFWEKKEDIESYSSYEEIKKDLKKSYPEMHYAWKKYKRGKYLMESACANIFFNGDSSDEALKLNPVT